MWRRFGRGPALAAVGIVVAVVLLAVMGYYANNKVNRNNPTAAEVEAASASAAAARSSAGRVDFVAGRRVLFIGDSWAAGYGASDPTQTSFVPLVTKDLGLTTETLSVSGAGYAHVSPTGATISSMVAGAQLPAPDLVLLMAGVNDAAEPEDVVSQGAGDALDQLVVKYPAAKVIVLGPMPPSPDSVGGMTSVGRLVAAQARAHSVSYVSTIDQSWLPVGDLSELIDPSKEYHPNDAGHRLIADRLESIISPLLPPQ